MTLNKFVFLSHQHQEEDRWLDALEKGELDDTGGLKKDKDITIMTARQVYFYIRTNPMSMWYFCHIKNHCYVKTKRFSTLWNEKLSGVTEKTNVTVRRVCNCLGIFQTETCKCYIFL